MCPVFLLQGFIKLSAVALSQGLPTRLILGWMSYAARISMYSVQAYWTPRSE
jgi:hypothetical protein